MPCLCWIIAKWCNANKFQSNLNKDITFFTQKLFKGHISKWENPDQLYTLCAWDVCYVIFCHSLQKHSGKTGVLFSQLLCSLWWVLIIGYVWACRSYSFVCTLRHFIIIIVCANLSEDIEFIKCLSDIFVECVRSSIISQLCITQYVGLCVFSLPISLWNNGMRCISLYILIHDS